VKHFITSLAFGCAVACAQAAVPAAGMSPTAKYVPTPAANNERLQILKDERQQIIEKLKINLADYPNAKDKEEAALAIKRAKADLAAIEREITGAEKQGSASPGATRTPQPVPAGDDVAHDSDKDKDSYESWDVFKNFKKKDSPQ
jgi:DNA-directed RNA polymerase subunit H (RpoH/RPB5)